MSPQTGEKAGDVRDRRSSVQAEGNLSSMSCWPNIDVNRQSAWWVFEPNKLTTVRSLGSPSQNAHSIMY